MADNIELTSLVSIASVKSSSASEASSSRFRTGSGSSSAMKGKGGFDGFLKTFLGNEKTSSGKQTGFSAHGRNNRQSQINENRFAQSNQARAQSDPSSSDPIESTEDMPEENGAAVAREAAQMIWEILYGQTNGASAELIAGGVDITSMPGSLTGTSYNANANSDAVLAAVEDAVSDMTTAELDDFLSQILGEDVNKTIDMDSFNRMAAELDATIVSVGGGEADLLASLAGEALHGKSAVTENIAAAAENTGSFGDTSKSIEEMLENFQEFIEEKLAEDPTLLSDLEASENGAALLEGFAKWLSDNGKASEAKQLLENPNRFIQSLAAGATSAAGGENGKLSAGRELFAKVASNLESWLQNNQNARQTDSTNQTAGSVPLGTFERKLNQGLFENVPESGAVSPTGQAGQGYNEGVVVHHQHSSGLSSLARADSTNPAAMSTMLDQIENIERVAEAMKMANRNGIKNLTMQLTPDELGKVMLRVESRDGVVNAYLRVEKPEAVAQLGSNLAQLRENLKAAGVELGQVTIEQRGHNEMLGDFSGQRQGGGGSSEEARNRIHWQSDKESPVPPDSGDRPPDRSSGGGLNLVA